MITFRATSPRRSWGDGGLALRGCSIHAKCSARLNTIGRGEGVMKRISGAVLASFALAAMALLAPSPAAANGVLEAPLATTPVGTFGEIVYIQYDGIFAGETSTGRYRVPYRITAPVDLRLANQT